MSFLDKKIKENKDFFDDQPLPEGHKNRFVDRLGEIKQEQVKKGRWPGLLKFAAVIIILVSGYFAFQTISIGDLNDQVMGQVTEISLGTELENVFAYYDAISEKKVEQIDKVAHDSTEANRIKQFAQRQLKELDANLAAIEKEYAKYPDNKRLKAAIINNKRKKAEIMDNILKQVDDANAQSDFMNPKTKMNTNP